MTDAAALTRRLGGKWHGGYGTARCPAHEDQSPSFSIRDGDRGLLLRCFAGCDPRDVYDALKRRGLIDDRPERHPTRSIHEQPLRRQQHDKAVWLWSQRRPIVGTIAEHYLRRARGYEGPLPATLGFLPPRKPEHPLIAAFAISDEPEPGLLGEPRDVTAVH